MILSSIVTLVPYIKTAGELKTKPTQHSVSELRRVGIQPDILLCRTEKPLEKGMKEKIALFCNVEPESVITAIDVDHIYEVPLTFHEQGLDEQICRKLNIWTRTPHLQNWEELVYKIHNLNNEVTIAMVGKYVDLRESYKSLNEALYHGGVANNAKVNIKFIDSEQVEREGVEIIGEVDGILVPGGFGARGVEGKLKAVQMARENNIPYFGICYGLHMAVIEFARNVMGWKDAHSGEIETPTPRIRLSISCVSGLISAPRRSNAATKKPTWAARCAWAPTPASSSRAPWPKRPTVPRKSPSATATAMSTTTNTVIHLPKRASS